MRHVLKQLGFELLEVRTELYGVGVPLHFTGQRFTQLPLETCGNAVTAGNDRDVFCSAAWDLLVFWIWQEGDCVERNNECVGQRASGMFGRVLRGQRGAQLGHVSGHQGRLSQA